MSSGASAGSRRRYLGLFDQDSALPCDCLLTRVGRDLKTRLVLRHACDKRQEEDKGGAYV